MVETTTKVRTNILVLLFVALAIALTAVGLEIFIPDLIGSLGPQSVSMPATVMIGTAKEPGPINSEFYPYWLAEKIGGGLRTYYTANGINMGSSGVNPATGQAYIRMTKNTDYIKASASSIPKGANAHITVKNIMDWMHDPKRGNIQNGTCSGAEKWSRTAEQILQSRCATGCIDWTTAFIALARAKGISASSVDLVSDRWITESKNSHCLKSPKYGHYVADVYTGVSKNGGWELADPTTGVFTVYQGNNFSGNALMRFNAYSPGTSLKPLGTGYIYRVFRRGIDAWDTGISSDGVWKNAVIEEYQLPSNPCQ